MKKMQKVFALILTAAMLIAVLAGCSERDPDDRGAILHIYLAADPSNINLDPAKMLFSNEAIKYIGLLFEGLFVMDDGGRLQNGMAKSYQIIEDEARDIYKMEITLKDTRWSDGLPVAADDFVYAWKRILEPDFSSPAAPLLYYIKNARAVKEGEMTVDDLGVVALDTTLLEITFERKIDYDKFKENLASIALAPVRADTVDVEPDTWATTSGPTGISLTLLSNGPFSVKELVFNRGMMLERSVYYLLEGKRNEAIDRFVKPYRIYLDFSHSVDPETNLAAQVDSYIATNNGQIGNNIFFLGNVPKSRFEEFRNQAVLRDMLSAYTVHFNAERGPLARPEVRQALSVALDRNHIAGMVGLGVKPATGIVPAGIVGERSTTDFRQENGDVISASADMSKARQLLQTAGVSSGSIELKVRNVAGEVAVAEYIAGVWRELGFNVTVAERQGRAYADDIMNTDYDAMLFDFQAAGLDAYSVLAPFAMPFSGSAKPYDRMGGVYVDTPFVTGFQNDAYDALIEEIFLIDNNSERHEKLKQAERALVELSPIAPLYFHTSINITEKLTGITYSKYGFPVFTGANLRNYLEYTTTIPERDFIE
jgi:oligopeptide transport system substrate-binding protein